MGEKKKNLAPIILIVVFVVLSVVYALNDYNAVRENGQFILSIAGLALGGFAAFKIIGKDAGAGRIILGILVGLFIAGSIIALVSSDSDLAFLVGGISVFALAIGIGIWFYKEINQ